MDVPLVDQRAAHERAFGERPELRRPVPAGCRHQGAVGTEDELGYVVPVLQRLPHPDSGPQVDQLGAVGHSQVPSKGGHQRAVGEATTPQSELGLGRDQTVNLGSAGEDVPDGQLTRTGDRDQSAAVVDEGRGQHSNHVAPTVVDVGQRIEPRPRRMLAATGTSKTRTLSSSQAVASASPRGLNVRARIGLGCSRTTLEIAFVRQSQRRTPVPATASQPPSRRNASTPGNRSRTGAGPPPTASRGSEPRPRGNRARAIRRRDSSRRRRPPPCPGPRSAAPLAPSPRRCNDPTRSASGGGHPRAGIPSAPDGTRVPGRRPAARSRGSRAGRRPG